ncbi:MAG: hypothetical protein FD126_29 [Elusimicrobia bacterium]|nr:MAG: hypothetical protein FD126_29 [Elusimicrobiota bacterium]
MNSTLNMCTKAKKTIRLAPQEWTERIIQPKGTWVMM